jgi:hypothetical protein
MEEMKQPMILGRFETLDEAVEQGRIALEKAVEEKALSRIGSGRSATSTSVPSSAWGPTGCLYADVDFHCQAMTLRSTSWAALTVNIAGMQWRRWWSATGLKPALQRVGDLPSFAGALKERSATRYATRKLRPKRASHFKTSNRSSRRPPCPQGNCPVLVIKIP